MSTRPENKVRILAPAGGREQLTAAIRCGADAVYLGAGGFNARRNAENFNGEGLCEAIAYAHEHGAEVYLTVNTLIMDSEFESLNRELEEIVAAGPDAIIVQDLAVCRLIRSRWPSLPIHASTQTAVHNAEGALAMRELGYTRVVLARELSLEEIRLIHDKCDIELETFVHGAHCMSVSGACYLSSVIGGRSGNRGLCAQPCRTDFHLNNRHFALSLKDMSLMKHIGELRDAGVCALKIEGRMKRPEYVAAAVTACRNALAGQDYDAETLRAVFSRSGFTDGYLTGKRTRAMFGYRTASDVSSSLGVLEGLSALYQKENQNIAIDIDLLLRANEPMSLTVSDESHSFTATGPVPEAAKRVAISCEQALPALSQTGGTAYYVRKADCSIDPGLSVPTSALKQLRRDALEGLARLRRTAPSYPEVMGRILPDGNAVLHKNPSLRLRFQSAEQYFPTDCKRVILPIEALEKAPYLIAELGSRLICELPELVFPNDEEQLEKRLAALMKKGVSAVSVNNIGVLHMARRLGLELHGDYGLNILNSVALAEYERLGLSDAVLSFELSMKRIAAMGGTLERGLIAYGYLPLMKTRACPVMDENGCGACTGITELRDSKDEPFTLVCRNRRYQELLNGVPLYIADKPINGADFLVLRFTTETTARARAVYEAFLRGASAEFPRTGGLYYRNLL